MPGPDGSPRLQVRDGGPGLAEEDLPVAFDQGVLRDRYSGSRPGGSGVGLALVDRLVRRMGGSVLAGHAAEGGASFTVTLPAAGPR
jgi:signal transduction histidine kinase